MYYYNNNFICRLSCQRATDVLSFLAIHNYVFLKICKNYIAIHMHIYIDSMCVDTYVHMLVTVRYVHSYVRIIILCTFYVFIVRTVRFTQSTYRVNEGDRSAQIVLVLSHPASTNIIVTLSSIDKSAKGTYINA